MAEQIQGLSAVKAKLIFATTRMRHCSKGFCDMENRGWTKTVVDAYSSCRFKSRLEMLLHSWKNCIWPGKLPTLKWSKAGRAHCTERTIYFHSTLKLLPRHLPLGTLKHGAEETFDLIQRSCSCAPVHCNGGAGTWRPQAPQLVALAPDAANGSLFCQCLKLALLDDLYSDYGQLNTSLQNLHIPSFTVAEK